MLEESELEEMEAALGTAQPTSTAERPVARLDGPCVARTLRAMRGLPPEALDQVLDQSSRFLGLVLDTYHREVEAGEVGAEGSATASTKLIEPFCPTGLLYGRIQSGKTAAMITFSALAIDNGFRIIVVLTSDNVELVRQTKRRFDDLKLALVAASTEAASWDDEAAHYTKNAGSRGLVIVCSKNSKHLQSVAELLHKIRGSNYPALILDDEADQASLDNNVRKRSKAAKKDDVAVTRIHERILELRQILRHHVFIQVTATPYALVLQNIDNPLKPRFAFLLEPGDGYTGGERFFTRDYIDDESASSTPPVVLVGESESDDIAGGAETAPLGLERALSFFLISAAAQSVRDPDRVAGLSQNFLCHTSPKTEEHKRLRRLIDGFLTDISEELEPLSGKAHVLFGWAYEELKRTLEDVPPLEALIDDIADRLPRRKIRVVNSKGKSTDPVLDAPNFIIGGNIVGRGLTIDNLLVTYYLRKPRVSQMDTMLQHARMFGYRASLMPYTRVFLPPSLGVRFQSIHQSEQSLRELLAAEDSAHAVPVPVAVVGQLRPTRYGVLDTATVQVVRTGQHLYPSEPDYKMGAARDKKIRRILEGLWPEFQDTNSEETCRVDADILERLLQTFDVGEWNHVALGAILDAERRRTGVDPRLGYRPMKRGLGGKTTTTLPTGALSGAELSAARMHTAPTLFVFRQVAKAPCWDRREFWYPTIVFPSSMPNQVYDDSQLTEERS